VLSEVTMKDVVDLVETISLTAIILMFFWSIKK
jgi:hypothetical protein